MSNIVNYPAVFQKEDIGYSVWVPDLPGCISQGDSFEDAMDSIKDAMSLYLDFSFETNMTSFPIPTSPDKIDFEKNQFVAMVSFDMVEFQKKYGNHAVKKTLTIPSWLNTLSEKNHLNYSAILQAALMRELNLTT